MQIDYYWACLTNSTDYIVRFSCVKLRAYNAWKCDIKKERESFMKHCFNMTVSFLLYNKELFKLKLWNMRFSSSIIYNHHKNITSVLIINIWICIFGWVCNFSCMYFFVMGILGYWWKNSLTNNYLSGTVLFTPSLPVCP